jgi:hypothetical protein
MAALLVAVIAASVLVGVVSGHFLTGLAVLFLCGIVLVLGGIPLWIISAVKTARRNDSD